MGGAGQAPEHDIENRKLLAQAGDDPKKLKKIVRKKAPYGSVTWTDATFERLGDADPEPLVSQFRVSHAMVLDVIARPGDRPRPCATLLTANHEPRRAARHVRKAFRVYRSLRLAGVVEKVRVPDAEGRSARRPVDLPRDFALNQPLSPFALAAMDLLDSEPGGRARRRLGHRGHPRRPPPGPHGRSSTGPAARRSPR